MLSLRRRAQWTEPQGQLLLFSIPIYLFSLSHVDMFIETGE